MIRITLADDTGDKCDTATLNGIVRRALMRDAAFREYAAFRGHDTLAIVTPADTPTGWRADTDHIDAPDAPAPGNRHGAHPANTRAVGAELAAELGAVRAAQPTRVGAQVVDALTGVAMQVNACGCGCCSINAATIANVVDAAHRAPAASSIPVVRPTIRFNRP